MIFGLSDSHWKIIMDLAIKPLQHLDCEVYIFGSRARGDNHKFSDLDVLYKSSATIPLSKIAMIKSDLEDSDLPIKIDLVDENDLAASYRESIEKDRRRIH